MIRRLLTAAILFSSITVNAKVFTVNPSNINDRIKNILSNIHGGDTILLKNGIYNVNLKIKEKQGDVDKPIVIMGEDRNKTVIDGGASEPNDKLTNYAFAIDSSSWLNIENLSIRNSWCDAIIANESNYISIKNLNVLGGRRLLFATGRKSHHFLVEHCYWEQGEKIWTKEPPYTWAEQHHGKYKCFNGSLFQGRLISGSFILRDNYIKNVYNGIRLSVIEGVENDTLACANGLIYNNIIENSADNAFEPEVYCKNLHFFHNKMINSHAFISLTEVGGGPLYFYGNTGIKKADCTDGWTIYKISSGERPFTRPVYIFNNSWQVDSPIYGREQDPFWTNEHIYHFNNAYYITQGDSVGFSFLSVDNKFGNDCSNLPFPSRVTNKLTWPDFIEDPKFVDAENGNFHISKDSPCHNKGIRPFGLSIGTRKGKLDIGAYDNGELVEGPVFRYMDLGPEMPDKEKPIIVKCNIQDSTVALWFSLPLDKTTLNNSSFTYMQNGVERQFLSWKLCDDNYKVSLKANKPIKKSEFNLVIRQAPIGTNGESVIMWGAPANCGFGKLFQTSMTAEKLAERLIDNVSFNLVKKPVTYNGGLIRLYQDSRKDMVSVASMAINSDSNCESVLGYSLKGSAQFFLNGKYIGTYSSENVSFKEYAYGRFAFPQSKKIKLKKGTNDLTIAYTSTSPYFQGVIAFLDKDNLIDNNVHAGNGNAYDSDWKILARIPISSSKLSKIKNLISNKTGEVVEYQGPMYGIYFAEAKNYKHRFNAEWNYSNCNTLLGMMNLYDKTQNGIIKTFIDNYFSCFLDNYQKTLTQFRDSSFIRGAYYKAHRCSMLDDTGGCAVALAEYCKHSSDKRIEPILMKFLNQVIKEQDRLKDGTLCRPEPQAKTIWADDLFMSIPFLSRMGKLTDNPKLYSEALRQAINFDKYLVDTETGIYKHGYNHERAYPISWGRANGWMLWALSEALNIIPDNQPEYEHVKEIFIQRLKNILKFQDNDGMFHQIINDKNSYQETSSTAMIAIALARALKKEWMPVQNRTSLLSAWNAIRNKIDNNWDVNGICSSTDLKTNADYYRNRPTNTNDPRGMGAVLTLCCEMIN